jgi:glutathione synthase
MHKDLVNTLGLQAAFPLACMPDNDAMRGMAGGLASAWSAVGRKDAAVLFVVQPGERNVFDQQWLQVRLLFLASRDVKSTDTALLGSAVNSDHIEGNPRHQDRAPHSR